MPVDLLRWPLGPGFFYQRDVSQAHLRCGICQRFTPFYNQITFHQMGHSGSIHWLLMGTQAVVTCAATKEHRGGQVIIM